MRDDLLELFLAQECNAAVRSIIEEAIASSHPRPEFCFNIFDVAIDRATNSVELSYILDASDDGFQRVDFDRFRLALDRCGNK